MNDREDPIQATRRFAYPIALVAFLLPFVTVSCMERQVTAPTGIQLAVGAEVQISEEFADELGGSDLGGTTPRANAVASEENSPDPWLLIAGAALLGATVIAFADKNRTVPRWVSTGLAVVALVALGIFWANVRTEAGELKALGFEITPGLGLWLAAAGALIGGAAEVMRQDVQAAQPSPVVRRPTNPSSHGSSAPAISVERQSAPASPNPLPSFCVQCGERFREQDRFCGHCGTPRSQ